MYGSTRLKAKHLTPLIVLFTLAIGLAGFLPIYQFIFSAFGGYYGWFYLRHFQVKEEGRGDPSDAFAFQTFFPEPMQ